MSKKFNPPDSISLNEVRIQKESMRDFQVTKLHFSLDQSRGLKNYLRQKSCVLVYGGSQFFYVMRTKKDDSLKEDMPTHLNVEYGEVSPFSNLPKEISRRFLFAFIENTAKRQGYIRGEGWQLYSPETQRQDFLHGHYAVDIGIREEDTCYSIFFDPTTLVLVPITLLQSDYLEKGRVLRKLIASVDEHRMDEFDFSTFPGRAGAFEGFENPDLDTILPGTLVYVKPSKRSDNIVTYPAFALRIVARRSEFETFNINPTNARAQMQPLPKRRFQETEAWINRVFPDSTIALNDRKIPIENRINIFEQAARYPQRNKAKKNLYYQITPLLFDSRGTQTNFSQKPGLKQFGPYDSNSSTRPFNNIRPYLVVPGGQYIAKTNQFMDFLSGEYQRRQRTSFRDDDFNGLNSHFNVEFDTPDEDDILVLEDATLTEYNEAADRILNAWAAETEQNERIVIVVVPNQGTQQDDPYLSLKKKFVEAGLPSQMVEMETLDQAIDPSFPFGHTLWTFALDLYVKLGGKPWTLARPINNVNCLIGLGFGRNSRQAHNPIYIGIANVFDQGGQWLDLNSDERELTDEEWQSLKDKEQSSLGTSSFKLHHEMSTDIISKSLISYNANTNQVAQKVVFHKNGDIYESEALGFLQALSDNLLRNSLSLSSARFALVSIYKNHDARMYGPPFKNEPRMEHTITKGSVRILNENTAIIATTGKHPFGYSGIGTPTPLIVERFVPAVQTLSDTGFNVDQMYYIEEICEHVLALTRLHWGAVNDIRLPITSEYSQRIAEFLASGVNAAYLLRSKRLWWI